MGHPIVPITKERLDFRFLHDAIDLQEIDLPVWQKKDSPIIRLAANPSPKN